MKVAVIGSRKIQIDSLDKYMPQGMSQLISGCICCNCKAEYCPRKFS